MAQPERLPEQYPEQRAAEGFPAGFLWGAATAAYQIEGAATEDGKGESIWDRFSHTPGAIIDQTTGDVACDHYHRWAADLDLVKEIGLNAYRFSLAWTRILPNGYGKINAAGLDHYSRLIDGLLERGITPYVTLYHWDLPQALQEKGGWEQRDTASAFAEFAQVAGKRFGDRVRHWITHNEPHVVVYDGFVLGQKAPGLRNPALIGPVAHHLLLSHGLGVQALRAETPPETRVAITLNFTHLEPATDRDADSEATRLLDGLYHRWFLDPLYRGAYPDDAQELIPLTSELVRPGDMQTIATPTDFLGVNYYTRARVRAAQGQRAFPETVAPTGPLTTMGWEVYPDGLYETLLRVQRNYAPKAMAITESGAAYPDTLTGEQEVHDPARVAYLRSHFAAARRAIDAGVPLEGYFVWSLMDNFEWSYGHTQRFGLLYTDYPTQRRILKDSARFMTEVAAANGANISPDD